jgi:phosphoglycolate phosphatase
LIFDWDNTLVDTWPAIHHALSVTFDAMGMDPWTFEETKARVRASARDAFPLLFGARAEEATRIFYGTFEASHLETLREMAGAGPMLDALYRDGYLLSVVSNKRGNILRREAGHLGWELYFHRLIGATDAVRDKPAREPVIMALQGSGVEPGDDVWFVGDTDIDMECARNARCRPVLLRASPPLDGEFGAEGPVDHVASCEKLAEFLAGR